MAKIPRNEKLIAALEAALAHDNVRAFLWMLRYGEGTQGPNAYNTLFGGELFDGYADHPRIKVTKKLRNGDSLTSTAAGAYQHLARTWDGNVEKYGFEDFSPHNQDLSAVALIAGRKALADVTAGRLEQAIAKCNREWASLPGSPYGQPVVTLKDCYREYAEAGGQLQPTTGLVSPSRPVATPTELEKTVPAPDSPTPEVKKMPAPLLSFAAAVLPSIVQLVPQLSKWFGSGSATQVRNVEAATAVIQIAKDAIGARNEQELQEQIASDPEAAKAVRAAIETEWFKLEEVGGGIAAAREANLKLSTVTKDPDGNENRIIPFYAQPAFIITCLLLVPVYFVVWVVLWPWEDGGQFSNEVKLVVVTAIISGVLSAVSGFWLGSSFGSQKKDEERGKLLQTSMEK